MRFACLFLAASALFIFCVAQPVAGMQQFYDNFVKQYIANHPDKTFAEMVTKEAKCHICHQGAKRTNRNVFGQELDKMLDKKTDTKDIEKMTAAFKKALEMHVDPKNNKSETYGDRLKASKLPAGELADLRKEPEKKETEKKGN